MVTSSMPRLRAGAGELTERFYSALFRTQPDARTMFPDDLTELRGKFLVELDAIVGAISDLNAFAFNVREWSTATAVPETTTGSL